MTIEELKAQRDTIAVKEYVTEDDYHAYVWVEATLDGEVIAVSDNEFWSYRPLFNVPDSGTTVTLEGNRREIRDFIQSLPGWPEEIDRTEEMTPEDTGDDDFYDDDEDEDSL